MNRWPDSRWYIYADLAALVVVQPAGRVPEGIGSRSFTSAISLASCFQQIAEAVENEENSLLTQAV